MTAPSPAVTAPARTNLVWRILAVWFLVVALASIVEPSWAVRRGALFLHLGALIAGFGAVLVVDLHGVLWLIGRRRLADLLTVSSALHPVIWGGLVVLVASGLLLNPDITLLRTQIKLVLVLVATLNGVWAHGLTRQLESQPHQAAAGAVDQRLLARVMCAGAISQTAWWGATLIGFLATTSR
jgi:hypothetical protein